MPRDFRRSSMDSNDANLWFFCLLNSKEDLYIKPTPPPLPFERGTWWKLYPVGTRSFITKVHTRCHLLRKSRPSRFSYPHRFWETGAQKWRHYLTLSQNFYVIRHSQLYPKVTLLFHICACYIDKLSFLRVNSKTYLYSICCIIAYPVVFDWYTFRKVIALLLLLNNISLGLRPGV